MSHSPKPPLEYEKPIRRTMVIRLDEQERAIVHFPPNCCLCMTATHEQWRVPAMLGPTQLKVPLCKPCQALSWQRYWMSVAASFLGVFGLATAVAFLARERLDGLNILGVAALIWLVFLALLQWLALPVRVGICTRWHRRVRIGFRNEQFARAMQD